jgi:hypothetical protein
MFVGFGTITGRASASGQTSDRSSFHLVRENEFSYLPSQFRATVEEFGRAQRERKPAYSSDKAKQN